MILTELVQKLKTLFIRVSVCEIAAVKCFGILCCQGRYLKRRPEKGIETGFSISK